MSGLEPPPRAYFSPITGSAPSFDQTPLELRVRWIGEKESLD
jgi:hypothetical protein